MYQETNTIDKLETESSEQNYGYEQLNYIRDKIENMSKFNQIEVLRILTKDKNVILNENKYGIHVNLSELDNDILNNLITYIKYVNNQEQYLDNLEQEKEKYKNTYFLKDNKDIIT